MFPELPALDADETFSRALGRVQDVCAHIDLTDSPSSLGNVAAGWPIFGQFVAHDMTADRSSLEDRVDTRTLRNERARPLQLDSIYGDGPMGHPFLFRRDDPAKFLLGNDDNDVPRNAQGTAIVADPRNDSHTLVAQMQLAMLKAHNRFVDDARLAGVPDDEVFGIAVREMRWHFQSAILDEFLPSLVGSALVNEALRDGPRWFRPQAGVLIPLEFAAAAYRYGHSQIRHRYQLNPLTDAVPLFPDLLGFRPVPRERTVDWTLFFDGPGDDASAQRAKKIDGRIHAPLQRLPDAITGVCKVEAYRSLATRDLLRGYRVGLPSGQAVARHLGLEPLTPRDIGLDDMQGTSETETPLWYYILREAAVVGNGERLGPVGGRIVSEVFVHILDSDPSSVRHAPANWRPKYRLLDLLTMSVGSDGFGGNV